MTKKNPSHTLILVFPHQANPCFIVVIVGWPNSSPQSAPQAGPQPNSFAEHVEVVNTPHLGQCLRIARWSRGREDWATIRYERIV
jgi:hypothetical protein